MTGIPAGAPATERALVRRWALGGVFLAGRTSDRPATIRREVDSLTSPPAKRTQTEPAQTGPTQTEPPQAGPAQTGPAQTGSVRIGLLVAVDQEGGRVQSLRGGDWIAIPTATVQGRWSPDQLRTRTRAWAKQLRSAGVTMNLAPVADTVPADRAGSNPRGGSNPPIGRFDRQYGSTPDRVAGAVAEISVSLDQAGVTPVLKHFPGLGRVRANTDTSTTAVDRTVTVDDPFLAPFRAGIEAADSAVMMSSARYPKLDADQLAVFSAATITGLLRTRLGFQGVVMTDDVGRAAAVQGVPVGARATRFIAAGGDLVLTVVPEHAPTMVQAIADRAERSSRFRADVDTAALRVLRLKHRNGLLTCS